MTVVLMMMMLLMLFLFYFAVTAEESLSKQAVEKKSIKLYLLPLRLLQKIINLLFVVIIFSQASLHRRCPIPLFVYPQLAHIFKGKTFIKYCYVSLLTYCKTHFDFTKRE